MIVAVTGATGYVGRFIVKRLSEAGETVRAWRRPTSDLRGLADGIEWIDGDLASPSSAAALVDGADMLVHAALEHEPGRYRGGEGDDLPQFLRANVEGSFALLDAARRAGVTRAVVLSSRAVFGRSAESPIADDTPVSPDTHYGEAKAALEVHARRLAEEGWPVAALRPTGVYGLVTPPERSKWFELVGRALKAEAVEPRAGTEVHGDDVAEAVSRLLGADPASIAGRAFNCSDIVVETREIVRTVQRIARVGGPLPAEAPPPRGIMRCDGLKALGVKFGGRDRFQATIEELVGAVRAAERL